MDESDSDSSASSELSMLKSSGDEEEKHEEEFYHGGKTTKDSRCRTKSILQPRAQISKKESSLSCLFQLAADCGIRGQGMPGRRTTVKPSLLQRRLETNPLIVDTYSQAPSNNKDFIFNHFVENDDASKEEKAIFQFLDKMEIHQVNIKEFLEADNKGVFQDDVESKLSEQKSIFERTSQAPSRCSSLFQRRLMMGGCSPDVK